MRKLIAIVMTTAFFSASAFAAAPVAQLESIAGKVLVNQGKGFVPATTGLALNAGDRILVGKDGAATLTYAAANCSVDVAATTIVSVDAKAPCTEGQSVSAVDSVFINAARAPGETSMGGVSLAPVVVPAFVVGAGSIFTFATIQQNRHRSPVSRP